MSVQYPIETLEGDPKSVYDMAIDGRLRTNPRIRPKTFRCFLEYVVVEAPIGQMLSTYSLADIAIKTRKGVMGAGEGHTDDVNRLVPMAFLDVLSFNCVQSSWINFTLYGTEGGELGKIQAVRSPSVGIINGLQVIFPELPDGDLEVLVGVEASCIDRLLHDSLWNKFAKAR